METAYIGIGSNIGDPRRNCLDAVDRIGRLDASKLISVSSFYLTAPVGVEAQEWYVNGAVSISTGLLPGDLMKRLLNIEADMGRVRTLKWGPRIIDLDILLFGQEIIDDITVRVPHPLMHLRRFVMAPMADLAPDLIHPVLKRTIKELFREIPENDQGITRLEGM